MKVTLYSLIFFTILPLSGMENSQKLEDWTFLSLFIPSKTSSYNQPLDDCRKNNSRNIPANCIKFTWILGPSNSVSLICDDYYEINQVKKYLVTISDTSEKKIVFTKIGPVTYLCKNEESTLLASFSSDSMMRILDLAKNSLEKSIKLEDSTINSMCLAASRKFFAYISNDNTLKIIDWQSQKCLAKIVLNKNKDKSTCYFNQDDREIIILHKNDNYEIETKKFDLSSLIDLYNFLNDEATEAQYSLLESIFSAVSEYPEVTFWTNDSHMSIYDSLPAYVKKMVEEFIPKHVDYSK